MTLYAYTSRALTVAVASVALHGCAVLPDTVAPELEHMSHASQHWPFTDSGQKVGADMANVTAEWTMGDHAYLALTEGFNVSQKHLNGTAVGEIGGAREEFTARVGYRFTVPK
jgi:hypothetical protein